MLSLPVPTGTAPILDPLILRLGLLSAHATKATHAYFARPFAAESGNDGRGAREMVDRRLSFFDGPLVAAEIRDDACGDFGHNITVVGPEGRPPTQFVHMCPVVPTGLAGSLLAN
jgi:hypothetical protein